MNEHTRRLQRRHEQRNGFHLAPEVANDPELASAYHALQLHWLATVPGYREEIRQRVAAAARKAQWRDERLDRRLPHLDIDALGPSIDPCG